MAKKKEQKFYNVVSPIGIISFPYIVKPDVGRQYSSNKYSIEIFVPKAVFIKEAKAFVESCLEVAREKSGNAKLKLSDLKYLPYTDMDKQKSCEDWQKGTIRVRGKASSYACPKDKAGNDPKDKPPMIIGPRKDPDTDKFPILPTEDALKIKGGDTGRIGGGVYYYESQGEAGVGLGLNFVQFAKEGKALGQGKMKQLENLGEIEVEVDTPDDIVDKDEEGDTDEVDPMTQFA